MLIQNVSNAASASALPNDGGSASIAAAQVRAAAQRAPNPARNADETVVVPLTDEQLKSSVDSINRTMRQNNANVEFSIDKDTKQTVIRVTESGTGKVIRQFPSEELLAVSRMIAEAQRGALVKQRA